MLKLSLIIPVYNEERHIRLCLDAVTKQTVQPDEVIVVDNNCTDRTIDIVREYPFAVIVEESRQGRGYARSAGFDAARGDIIGRVDADSRIDPDWVARAKQRFSDDPELGGLTGLGRTGFLPGITFIRSTLASRCYFWGAHAIFDTVTMWGANMAIRREAWQSVRGDVVNDDAKVHEDQDISLWMAAGGAKIRVDSSLRVITNGQSYRYLPKFVRYVGLVFKTRALHRRHGSFAKPAFPHLGVWHTLPGRVYGLLSWAGVFTVSIVLFPIDYIVNKLWPNSFWLD